MKNDKAKTKFSTSVKNIFCIYGLVFKTTPWYIIGRIVMGLVTGLKSGIEVFLISEVLNAIDRGESFEYIVKIILAMAVFWLCYHIFFHLYWGQMNAINRL